MTDEVFTAKHKRRSAERQWRNTKLEVNLQIYQAARNEVNCLIRKVKIDHIARKITESKGNSKQLFAITKKLTDPPTSSVQPSQEVSAQRAEAFADFFLDKVENIRENITRQQQPDNKPLKQDKPFSETLLLAFDPAEVKEVADIIKSSPCKSCELDPIPF